MEEYTGNIWSADNSPILGFLVSFSTQAVLQIQIILPQPPSLLGLQVCTSTDSYFGLIFVCLKCEKNLTSIHMICTLMEICFNKQLNKQQIQWSIWYPTIKKPEIKNDWQYQVPVKMWLNWNVYFQLDHFRNVGWNRLWENGNLESGLESMAVILKTDDGR